MDATALATTILTIAAGGGLAQGVRVALAAGHKRFSKAGQRTENVSTDSTSVQTADAVLVMVRGELQRLTSQREAERKEWDAERRLSTDSMDNAAREMDRAHAELARRTADLAVARAQIAELTARIPGRHSTP